MLNNLGSSLSDHSSGMNSMGSSHGLPSSHHHADPPHPEPEPSALEGRMSRFGGLGHTIRSRSGKILGQVTASGRVLGRWGQKLGRIGSTGKIYARGSMQPAGRVGSHGELFKASTGRVHASEFHNDSKSAFMSIFKK